MSLYVIILSTEPDYLLLRKIITDRPALKKGFTLKEILKVPSLFLNDRKNLKKMFGGEYSEVLTPTIDFEYRNGRWAVEEIDVKRGVHQFITKILDQALKDRKYALGSPVSTKDTELVRFLMRMEQEVYERERDGCDEEDRFPINHEMLEYILTLLQERLGEMSCFDYGFITEFVDALHDYEGVLIEREWGEVSNLKGEGKEG